MATSEKLERKLAAVLYADVAGYSRLTGEDEEGTHRRLSEYLDLISAAIQSYNGTVVHYAGDAVLAEFPTVTEALTCAARVQQMLAEKNQNVSESKVEFRIGVNLGEVIVDRNDIYGDGVNVAARLEGLAEPGGICVSESVYTAVGNKLPLDYDDLGEQEVKNIANPVRAFRACLQAEAELPQTVTAPRPLKKSTTRVLTIAIALALIVGGGFWVWLQLRVPEFEPTSVENMAHSLPNEAMPARTGLPENQPLVMPDKPSIAVLPFANMSDDVEQEYFADGMTDDLITDLSKISGLFVVARNSSFAYKGESPDVRQVGRELGVKYVLEGSVRRAGDKVRINAQLIDTSTGGHIWAERFDGTMADVFSLQDDVNEKIAAALAVNLTVDDRNRLHKSRTANPDAYDMLLRGLEQFQRYNAESNVEGRDMFKQAITLDPNYARAYSNVALTYVNEVTFNWTPDREESIRLGLEYAAKALALDESIPQIYLTRSTLYLTQQRHDAAVEAARRTIEVHPNYADGHASLAFVLTYSGELEAALETIHGAKRLNPQYSYIYLVMEGHILFLMGRYQEAAPILEESVQRNPVFDRGQLLLAATYAQLGESEDAAWAIEEALTIRPNISLAGERRDASYRKPQDLERYIEGLRKAGLPEQ